MGCGTAVLIPDYSPSINHEIAAHLPQVATPEVVQAATSQELSVCQDGSRTEHLGQTAPRQAIGPINVTLGVGKQVEGQPELTGQLEQPVTRFK